MDPEFAAALAVEPFAHLRRGLPEGMSFPEYTRQTRAMVAVLDEFYGKRLPEGRLLLASDLRSVPVAHPLQQNHST